MEQLNKQQAVDFYNDGEWSSWTDKQIVDFQLNQERLCLPFSLFHKAMESVLGRPVFTHEFADRDGLLAEYNRKKG